MLTNAAMNVLDEKRERKKRAVSRSTQGGQTEVQREEQIKSAAFVKCQQLTKLRRSTPGNSILKIKRWRQKFTKL